MEATLAHIAMGMDTDMVMTIAMKKEHVVAMTTIMITSTTTITIMNISINTMTKMQITMAKSLTSNR